MGSDQVLDFTRWLRPASTVAITSSTVVVASSAAATTAAAATADIAGIPYVRTPDEQASTYFREHSSAVYRYLAGVYGREEDAEEVTQEAFLRLHQALVSNIVIESPRAWTLTVARRLMLDRLRHERGESTRVAAVGSEVIEAVRDPAPSPEETLAKRRRLAALTRAVHDLTDLERQCLYARAQGLTLKEVGQVVNMDLRRVAEVVTRAVRKLEGRLRA
jgi:RNA polymerase sigma-70 factor, ECF subfamily